MRRFILAIALLIALLFSGRAVAGRPQIDLSAADATPTLARLVVFEGFYRPT